MTADEYEADICARLANAQRVPFESRTIGDWRPEIANCHANVERWVRANPGSKGVQGWVEFANSSGDSTRLTAHSIVQAPDGRRFDITPVLDEPSRFPGRFVEHMGDDQSFRAMKANGLPIICQDGRPAPKFGPEVLLDGWAPPPDDDMD